MSDENDWKAEAEHAEWVQQCEKQDERKRIAQVIYAFFGTSTPASRALADALIEELYDDV